jgi:peptidoglycan biosynthesis protein MviN/MurJ (putative lipid II flippase)
MTRHISFYINKYPARISGYISAIILNVSHMWSSFPLGLFVPVAMLLIILGEGSQRMENKKTIEALYQDAVKGKSEEDMIKELIMDLKTKENKHE